MVFKVRKRNVDPIPPLREEVDHRRAEQVEVVLGNHLLQFRRRPIEMQNEFNFRGANIFQDVAQLADLEEPEAVRASKILMQQAVTAEALLTVWNKGLVGLEAHAAYLKAAPQHKVVIQGNTDARGSREYNLGLGQRRAESVKRSLAVLGAKESQLEAVSFGKEKPKASGNTEADYAQNRRADIVYDGE